MFARCMTDSGSSGPLFPAARKRWAGYIRPTPHVRAGPVRTLAWGQLGDRPVLAGGSIESTVWLWNPEQSNEQLYRSLAGAGWLATRQTQLAWVIARRIRLKWWALAAGTVAAGVLIGVFAARYRGWLFGLVVATAG